MEKQVGCRSATKLGINNARRSFLSLLGSRADSLSKKLDGQLKANIALLSSPDPKKRENAALLISYHKGDTSSAFQALKSGVEDPAPAVAQYSVCSIGRLAREGNSQALRFLGELLLHQSDIVVFQAESIMRGIVNSGMDIASAREQIRRWISKLYGNPDQEGAFIKAQLLSSLHEIGQPGAIETLEKFASESSDERTRFIAARLLERIK